MPERRQTKRFSVRLDAQLLKGGELYSAQATNASETGCLLVTLAQVNKDERIAVSFRAPAVASAPARVIRSRRVGDFSVVAVHFEPPLTAKFGDVGELLEARESEAAADFGSLF